MTRRHTLKELGLVLGVLAMLGGPAPTGAQIEISGQLDLVGKVRSDTLRSNTAFRGDSPFNSIRLKLFARHWVSERIGIFTELLFDSGADPRVNGAYVVINELGGQSWLNTRVGLAPSVVGSFGLRATYFNANPLIGVPLVWQYRTNLSGGGAATNASLTSATSEPGGALPLLYESCWNIQWELLGEFGSLEYSVAMTPGSISNPIKSTSVSGSSFMGRLGYAPVSNLRFGISGAWGPFLSQPEPDAGGTLPYDQDPSDFKQYVVGFDLEYQGGPLALFSEIYGVRYELPLVQGDLDALGGFVELRYDFLPGWYVAGRLGGLFFSDIETGPSTGVMAPWDHDTRRTEVALGYRIAREVLLKLDWQRTTAPDADFSQNLFAVQLSSAF